MKTQILAALIISAGLLLVSKTLVGEDKQGAHFEKSVELEASGKYQDSLNELTQITGAGKDSYLFHLRHGWLLYLLEKYDASATAYRAAVKAEPESVEARLGLLMPLLAVRKWVDAEKEALAALKLDPNNYLANSRLAYAYYNLTRYKDAEERYRKVVELYPGDTEMRAGLAWALFQLGRYDEAKREFAAILLFSPTHASAIQGVSLCP